MQIPTWLGHVLKSGEVSLFTDGVKALQLKAENKKIDVDLINKELLINMLRVETKRQVHLSVLTQLKKIAEELKKDELTVTISHEGRIVLTLGSGAKPKLLKLVTRTNAIQINNLSKLMQLVT